MIGAGGRIKSVDTIPVNSAKKLKIAIYYGCLTGVTTSVYGDLPGQTVSKGAQAAVAWTVETHVAYVNEWNR